MADASFIPGFEADHRAVLDGLLAIQAAVLKGDLPAARKVLGELNEMVGPHFKFEDEYLYPVLRRFLGNRVDQLYQEHDAAVEGAQALATLFEKDVLTPEERERAVGTLPTFFGHVANCDGLRLLAERLDPEEQDQLADKFEATKKERLLLTERAPYRQS